MGISLRPIDPKDRQTLLAIYGGTRTDELALTSWTDDQKAAFVLMQFDAQERHYLQHYPESQCQMIVHHGEAVGRLWVDRRADSLHVLDISVLANARGLGIGTQCFATLMQEASARAVPLTIYVELQNRARGLYERLGFEAAGPPQGIYQYMCWQPEMPVRALPASNDEEYLS